MNAIPIVLCLALAADPINLKAGDVAPFDGALCDFACAEGIRIKRAECETQNRQLREALAASPPQQTTPSGYAIVGLIGLAAGILIGGAAVAYVALRN